MGHGTFDSDMLVLLQCVNKFELTVTARMHFSHRLSWNLLTRHFLDALPSEKSDQMDRSPSGAVPSFKNSIPLAGFSDSLTTSSDLAHNPSDPYPKTKLPIREFTMLFLKNLQQQENIVPATISNDNTKMAADNRIKKKSSLLLHLFPAIRSPNFNSSSNRGFRPTVTGTSVYYKPPVPIPFRSSRSTSAWVSSHISTPSKCHHLEALVYSPTSILLKCSFSLRSPQQDRPNDLLQLIITSYPIPTDRTSSKA